MIDLLLGIPSKTVSHLTIKSLLSAVNFKRIAMTFEVSVSVRVYTDKKYFECLENSKSYLQDEVELVNCQPRGIYPAFNHIYIDSIREMFKYVMILGDDDLIAFPANLLHLISHLKSSNSSDIVSTSILIGDNIFSARKKKSYNPLIFNLDKMRINHPGMIVSTKFIKESNLLFSENFGTVADYDWALRAFRHNPNIINNHDFVVFHRLGGASSSTTKSALRDHLYCLKSIRTNFPSFFLIALILRTFRFMIRSSTYLFKK